MAGEGVSPAEDPTSRSGDVASPTLSERALAELAAFGSERAVDVGDTLFRAGDASYDFVVVLEGEVEVVRPDRAGDVVIVTHGPGRFLGELSLVTGERPYLTARVSRPGRVLVIERDAFKRMMSSKPDISDVIFSALMARRERLQSGDGGPSGADHRLSLLARGHGPAERSPPRTTWPIRGSIWRTPRTSACCWPAWGSGPLDTPVVVTSTAVLRHPTAGRVRRATRASPTADTGTHVRPGGGGERPGRSGRRRLRRLRGAGHRVARCGGARGGRPGPARGSRTTRASPTESPGGNSRGNGLDPGPTTRGPAGQRPLRGRRAPRRGRVPRA